MADAIVYFDNETGKNVYVQFDDTDNTRVQLVEGTSSKLRRYVATDAALVTASLDAGRYNATIRVGLAASPTDTDLILQVIEKFEWSGAVESLPQVDTRQFNGIAVALSADNFLRIDVASFNRYVFTTDVVMGQNIQTFFKNNSVVSTKKVDDIPLGFILTAQGVTNFQTLLNNEGAASDTVLDDLTANSTPITVIIDED